MSAAYYLAFTDLRRRMHDGELNPDDLVFTVDADGQHELEAFDELQRQTLDERLDALLVRRDLSTYPRYKQIGNELMSWWARRWSTASTCTTSSPATGCSGSAPWPTPSTTTGLQVQRDRRGGGRASAASATGAQRRARPGAGVPVAHPDEGRRHRPRGDADGRRAVALRRREATAPAPLVAAPVVAPAQHEST